MLLRILASLPFWVLYRLSDLLFIWLFYLQRYRRSVVAENLRLSFPDWPESKRSACARSFYRGFCDVLLESIKGSTIRGEDLRRRVVLENVDLPHGLVEQYGSVIALTGHTCNWEWLLLGSSLISHLPLDAIYKPLHDEKSNAFMYRMRSRFGATLIDNKDAIRTVAKRRSINRVITIVADQTPGKLHEKYWGTFLGRDTPFYLGAELIARFTRYPVVFAAMRRVRRGHYAVRFELLCTPPYRKHDHKVLEAYVAALEKQIRQQPAAWLWSHRKWKYSRPQAE